MSNGTTKVRLLSNVPFNVSYNNVRDFENVSEQLSYFLQFKKYEIDNNTYQRVNKNSIQLEISYDEMLEVNYLMFQNEENGKWYYAFITNYTYISPNVTRIDYQIDVFQTYLFEMEFKTSYIERRHTRRFDDDGFPVINTLEEGLDYGSDYQIVDMQKFEQCENTIWCVVISKVALESIPTFKYGGSTIGGIQTPLYFYILPLDITTGNSLTISVNGGGAMPFNPLSDLFNLFSTNADFVGSIVTMYYTSYVPLPVTRVGNIINVPSGFIDRVSVGGYYFPKVLNFQNITRNIHVYDNIYSNFPKYTESKLYMYPYSICEISDMSGNTFTMKMENLTRVDNTKALDLGIMTCIGFVPKTAIYPMYYLNNTNFLMGAILDYGIINTETSDIPIVDDYTATYMQSNRNTINTTNKYAMDNAIRSVSQNNANNRLQNAVITREEQYNQTEAGLSMLGNALSADFGGMLSSGYNMIKSYDLAEANRAGINMNNAFQNKNIMINAEQQIGLTQAKLQDINNVPPTVSNLGNNAMFNLTNKINGVYVMLKTIKPEYRERLTNYFKMFGYRVNSLEVPKLRYRESYNYIKTVNVNIVGNIPEMYLETIKGIFDRGLTIWHIDDIGNYNLDNEEV